MIAKRFNAKEFTVRLKATIQATGKLGFTQDTIDQLRLTSECSVFLAPDDENKKGICSTSRGLKKATKRWKRSATRWTCVGKSAPTTTRR